MTDKIRADGLPEVIISMTSYPQRISGAATVLRSLLSQTVPADRIQLWLADSQFPARETDLPQELRQILEEQEQVELRWCEDLKSHKKYFYAMQENPDSILITVDDDEIYRPDLTEKLLNSYRTFPGAVSACRVHMIVLDEEHRILPYRVWMRETDGCLNTPSMQLMAVGVGGVLYPPRCLGPETFDLQGIRECCLHGDDLWLKAMELLAGVPTVLAGKTEPLRHVPDSQRVGLFHQNQFRGENDAQLRRIMDYVDARQGEQNVLQRRLCQPALPGQESLLGISVLAEYAEQQRQSAREEQRRIQADKFALAKKLETAERERAMLIAKAEEMEEQKDALQTELKAARGENSTLNARLQQASAKRSVQEQEIYSLKAQVRRLKSDLEEQRKKEEMLKGSKAYRLGQALTGPMRRLRGEKE